MIDIRITRLFLVVNIMLMILIFVSGWASGALSGASFAWSQSAQRSAECHELNAKCWQMIYQADELGNDCVCAVKGWRCRKQ